MKKIKILLAMLLTLVFALCAMGSGDSSEDTANKVEVSVIDLSEKTKTEIKEWAEENNLEYEFKTEYSDTVIKGDFVNQNPKAGDIIYEGDKIEVVYSLGKEPSMEYKNALAKAETYSEMMHMSKQGIYDQLVSEYGEDFPEDAAQYAIDNLDADYKENALEKAKSYQETMHMSKSAIYDQLISDYGEKFTKDEAQYAIDNLPD